MPPRSKKIKPLLIILWNQKTKMLPLPSMVLTFKFFWLPGAWYERTMGGRTMLNYFFRRWVGFRAVFTYTQVFMKEKNVVSHLLQKYWRRLLPVTQSSLISNIRKMKCKFWFHSRLLLLSQPASPALRLLLLKKFGSKSLNYHWNISKNCIWDNMGVEGPR